MKSGAPPPVDRPRTHGTRVRRSDAPASRGTDPEATRQTAPVPGLDEPAVRSEPHAVFDEARPASPERLRGETRDVAPVSVKGTAHGARALDVLSASRAMASTRRWDPVARLPAELRARLTDGDKELIAEAVAALQRGVREHKLDWVPVFGYLSLRTHNFAELGKKSQDEVVAGRDVVNATLAGFDIDVVASSMFRGTPEHPGAVAGLGPKEGASTPGVVLKVPLARAEELLAVLFARELFAEGDLKDGAGTGRPVSNAMYAPRVETVSLEGGPSVPALVFVTNDRGAKAVDRKNAFGDERGLTLERMAFLFSSQGGYVDADGKAAGGPSIDYWQKFYVEARQAAGQPVDAKIAAAIELSKLHPQKAVVDRLLARTDRDARLMVEALRHLFEGAATPLGVHRQQKRTESGGEGLRRTPQGTRGDDAASLLLEKARELAKAGKIRVD